MNYIQANACLENYLRYYNIPIADHRLRMLRKQTEILHEVIRNLETRMYYGDSKGILFGDYIKDESCFITKNKTSGFLGRINAFYGKIAMLMIRVDKYMRKHTPNY